jgi:pyruvate kinase
MAMGMLRRRTKIVCTIGPACDSEERLEQLLWSGLDVARLNFSHGTHEEHLARIQALRSVSTRLGKPIALLQDLCGPKIRTGRVPGGTLPLETNSEIILVEGREARTDGRIPVQYQGLADDLKPGDPILVDDGRIVLRVLRARGSGVEGEVTATVVQGGVLRNMGGVHIPATRVRLSAITEKDKEDLAFGLTQGVDYVALSFVKTADDVKLVREICEAWGRPTPIIAKIETPSAVDHLESILEAADGVMVARGDLGVEFPPERVPVIQKQMIAAARRRKVPVIVATEMLQSMVESTRPTRAEASDVANAVYDGTDCVMLSGETASGKHPVLACGMMARIVTEAEESPFYLHQPSPLSPSQSTIAESIAANAASIAHEIGARIIVALSESGRTAHLVSQARPKVPIIAFSPNERTRRQLALCWGVTPHPIDNSKDVDEMVDRINGHVQARGYASPGDRMVIVFGAPLGVQGSTNTIRVRVVG